jgi:hypothetical protein
MNNIEIDEQAERFATQLHIRHQLRFVDRSRPLTSLNLSHYEIVNDHINAITNFQMYAVLNDRQTSLRFYHMPTLAQLERQACFIRALQQPRPEF